MPSHRPALKFWLLPLLWMLVIFSASGDPGSAQHSSRIFEPLMHWLFPQMPQARIEDLHYLFRKGAHLTEFGVLAALFWQAIRRSNMNAGRGWVWRQAGWALALVVVYAASDELHQAFVPGRTGQVSDVLVDALGGALGLGVLWLAGKACKRW